MNGTNNEVVRELPPIIPATSSVFPNSVAEEEDQQLVRGILTRGRRGILAASNNVRTNMALQLATCVAAGTPYLNRPTRQGRCVFVNLERAARAGIGNALGEKVLCLNETGKSRGRRPS